MADFVLDVTQLYSRTFAACRSFSHVQNMQNSAKMRLAESPPGDFSDRLTFPPFSVLGEMFKSNLCGLRVNFSVEHFANAIGVCAQHLNNISERCTLLSKNVRRYGFILVQRLAFTFDLVQLYTRDRVLRNCHGVTSYGDAVRSQFLGLRATLSALLSGAVTLAESGTMNPRFGDPNVGYEVLVNQPFCCGDADTYPYILWKSIKLTLRDAVAPPLRNSLKLMFNIGDLAASEMAVRGVKI